MDTKKFKTKTIMLERSNIQLSGKWTIALDVGYSSVKVFAPNMVAMFPSFAERVLVNHGTIGRLSDEHIKYTDLVTGEVWNVGQVAQDNISREDAALVEGKLYQKERYNDPMFKVITRVGIGLGLLQNQYGAPKDKPIYIQTGLPPKYLDDQADSDISFLTDVIAGEHHFSITLGSKKPLEYHINIPQDNVFVTAQPKGTLFSIAANNQNRFIPEAKDYFSKKLMIFDAGFGTIDLFPLRQHEIGNWQTIPNLAMKRVLEETTLLIKAKHGQSIAVPAMQQYLETGTFKFVDRKRRIAKSIQFGDLLEEANKKVCAMALNQMEDLYPILEYDYLVITGGTGAAWKTMIHEFYKNVDTLKIIDGNQNDLTLGFTFANARGYYLMRHSFLRNGG